MNPHLPRRLALWVVMVAVSGAVGGLWWTSHRTAAINFLPRLAPAQWIVYPTAPDMRIHHHLELPSIFKTSFDLKKVPAEARLRVAGFHQYELSINGTLLRKPLSAGRNWKQPDMFDVSGQLRPGENQVEVTVVNTNGPPALWFYLEADSMKVCSGEDWQASHAGATWHTAVLASKPKEVPAGCAIYGGDEPWFSLRVRWPWLLVFALLSGSVSWWITFMISRRRMATLGLAGARHAPEAFEVRRAPGPTGRSAPPRSWMSWKTRGWTGKWSGQTLTVLALAGLWVALFANNLGALPSRVGYDADEHLAYIRYIQQNHALPLASQGWEMFQPPLYYLVSEKLLSLFSLSTSDSGTVLTLRILGFICGLSQILLIRAALRLVYPDDASKQTWGLVLAACLAPVLYLSQYVSNEGMSAALATACLYLCLRILKRGSGARFKTPSPVAAEVMRPKSFRKQKRKSEPPHVGCYRYKGLLRPWACLGLGVCLGAALLAKSTNILLVPAILGALLWRWLEKRDSSVWQWVWRAGIVFMAAAAVCGWHYARVWWHYGNPLIGNWDPRARLFTWWMDDGYRTGAYYLHWGSVLRHPWFAGFRSFGDGIYSTLWGDGLLGGAPGFDALHPPWNYDLMAIGYWLAVVPSLGILVGAIAMLFKFIGRPSAEWFLLLGFGFVVAVGVAYMSLVVPCGGMTKAFYGLPALLPLSAVAAAGMDYLAGRGRYRRFVACMFFGVWALNSFGSLWVVRSSVSYAVTRTLALIADDQKAEATEYLRARMQANPRATLLRLLYASNLPEGDLEGAERQMQIVLQQEPDNDKAWLCQAAILANQRENDKGMEAARRGMALGPGNDVAYQQLGNLLISQNRYEEAVVVCREGLHCAAPSPRLRTTLAFALLFSGRDNEAAVQFRYAYGMNRDLPKVLNSMAWIMATDLDARKREGNAAVKIAKQACELTQYQNPSILCTLAAAYAEAGRFDDAVKAAEQAQAAAFTSGEKDLAERIQELIDGFKSGKAYRRKNQ